MLQRLPDADYKAICKFVLQRDGWKCRSCFSRNALHVHHIVFRSQQGPDAEWNLITLCSSCHDGVHKDVKSGVYGLTIVVEVKDGEAWVTMVRREGWRPK